MIRRTVPAAPTPIPAFAPVDRPSSVCAAAEVVVVIDVWEAVVDVINGLVAIEVIVDFVPDTSTVVVVGAYTKVGSNPFVQYIESPVLFGRLA